MKEKLWAKLNQEERKNKQDPDKDFQPWPWIHRVIGQCTPSSNWCSSVKFDYNSAKGKEYFLWKKEVGLTDGRNVYRDIPSHSSKKKCFEWKSKNLKLVNELWSAVVNWPLAQNVLVRTDLGFIFERDSYFLRIKQFFISTKTKCNIT